MKSNPGRGDYSEAHKVEMIPFTKWEGKWASQMRWREEGVVGKRDRDERIVEWKGSMWKIGTSFRDG